MSRPSTPGVFLTFEGVDGSGKTTQLRLLDEWLHKRGVPTLVTREPGGTEIGRRIREIVLHERGAVDPRAEALLYAADRAQHIATVVRPALEEGLVVLQDRYLDSSVAYQGSGRRLDAQEIRRLSLWAANGLQPDLTVLLDIDDEAARRRLAGRTRFDRLEAEDAAFRSRVAAAYRALAAAEPVRFVVLDATVPEPEIARRVAGRVEDLLRTRRSGPPAQGTR